MHICLLTPSFPPLVDGGVAISTGRLVERLLLAGHRLTVVTRLPPRRATAVIPWHDLLVKHSRCPIH